MLAEDEAHRSRSSDHLGGATPLYTDEGGNRVKSKQT